MQDIAKVFNGAFAYVIYYRKELTKALCIPFSILILLEIIEASIELSGFTQFFMGIVYVLAYTVLAVTTHRIILLNESSVPEWGLNTITRREIRFLWYSIVSGLVLLLPLLLALIPVIGWLLALIATPYVLGRISLVFPAIATDKHWDFADSWNHTKHHQVLMAATVFVLPLVFSVPNIVLATIPYASVPAGIVASLATIFVIAALSSAYKLIELQGVVHREDHRES